MKEVVTTATNLGSTKGITPLAAPEQYSIWATRAQIELERMGKWNPKTQEPIESQESASFIITILADNMLEQVIDSDKKAVTMWTHFKTSILVSSISAQSLAITKLQTFSYPEKNMRANKDALLAIKRGLKTAFNNSDNIKLDELVTLFALVNTPSEYLSLRTALETTKSDLTFDDFFANLIREEASMVASSNRAYRVAPTAFESEICAHDRAKVRCWSCHPELRPTCIVCKTNGAARYNHTKERCPKLRKKDSKAEA